MKNRKLPVYIISMLVATVFFLSCKEENPGVILEKPPVDFKDTSYTLATPETPQAKNAMIEDFTGARCSNCPKGHHAIEQMRQNHPGRIVAMSIHSYDFPNFTTPLDSTKDVDMRVPYGDMILNIVGRPLGLPFGTIDRTDKSATAGAWEGLAVNRMAGSTPVNLYIERVYNDNTRQLDVKLKAVFTDSMASRPFFSVGIVQSGIITPQKDEDLASDPVKKGIEPNYVHNHVLRFMPAFKQPLLPAGITGNPQKNRVVEKSFSIKMKDDWKVENCDIVFYVHKDVEIVQAVELKIK